MSVQTPTNQQPLCPKTGKSLKPAGKHRWVRWLFPVTGLLALIWFLVRVIPKPSRAAYPCLRVAAPLASSFVVWLIGLAGSLALLHKTKRLLRKSRYVVAATCFVAAVLTLWFSGSITSSEPAVGGTFTPADPPNSPIGIARGIHPGRVVWVYDPNATSWDGSTGYWSTDDNTDPVVVSKMVSNAICWLTGRNCDADAWDALFKYFNNRHDKGDVGYTAGEKIAIKLNLAQCSAGSGHINPGNASYTVPQLVEALLKQLVNNAGVAPSDITVYDASRCVPDPIYDRCSVGDLTGVRFADRIGGDGRIKAERDLDAIVYHAHPNVPRRWLPDFVAEAEYVINLAGLKGHMLPGVTLCAKNYFGSTWVKGDPNYTGWLDDEGFWPGYKIHMHINAYDTTGGKPYSFDVHSSFSVPQRPPGSYNPLVELLGHKDLGGKTVLFMIDGLYPAKHCGASVTDSPPWLSPPFKNNWTSSIFASQDGVAIDSVGLDFIRCEPTIIYVADDDNYSIADDYMHEAALANDPCSGTFYDPELDGTRLESLGVHEHWNNVIDKQYSRNLGTGDGIELISSNPLDTIPGDFEPDGDVDLFDVQFLSQNWLQPVPPRCDGDLDGDGYVHFVDFAILASHWLDGVAP